MRLTVDSRYLRRLLMWTQRALLVLAILLLAYGGLFYFNAWRFQDRESRLLNEQVRRRKNPADSVAVPTTLPANSVIGSGEVIGRIQITRLGVSVIVIEGANADALRNAAGHIPGTALPGRAGNIGISAHRDTYFRPLRNIRRDDIITIATPLADYRYRVLSTLIVKPEDTSVLKTTPGEVLTLITCYPFYFVGSAPSRFIVRAERIT